MRKYFILWVSALLLLSGCTMHHYGPAAARMVTFKTPQFRFSDMGYLRESANAVQLDLYSGGQPVRRFEIGERICVDEGCMSAADFNRAYLSALYPDDLLLRVLQGKPLDDGRNIERRDDGFIQNLEIHGETVIYQVTSDTVHFKDGARHILIRIRTP